MLIIQSEVYWDILVYKKLLYFTFTMKKNQPRPKGSLPKYCKLMNILISKNFKAKLSKFRKVSEDSVDNQKYKHHENP